MAKKMKTFKGGGKIKRYAGETDGSLVEGEGEEIFRKAMRDRDAGSAYMNNINADVRRALAGERPSAPEYTQLPESKENKFVKAANKIQKSQEDRRNMEATTSRGMPAVDKSVPSASSLKYQAPSAEAVASSENRKKNYGMFDAIKDYYASPSSKEGVMRNLSNTAAALTPMTGGASKVATEFAMGRNAAKASQGEGKLSAAGQRLKNMEEVRNVAMPGRKEAVTNPMAWAGGPKMMEKVSAQEAQVVRAAQAAAKKKAAQDKRDAKDPLMNARPGADKAKPASKTSKAKPKSKYETDEAMDISFGYKKGGSVKKFAKGGSVSSASSRADGCAIRGKTKGMISKMKSGGMYGGKGAC
jgi:hypothetical protein